MDTVISVLLGFIFLFFVGYVCAIVTKSLWGFYAFFLGATVFLETVAVVLLMNTEEPVNRWIAYLVGVAIMVTFGCGGYHFICMRDRWRDVTRQGNNN